MSPTETQQLAIVIQQGRGKSPSSLVSLIHVANNLCKEIGMAYADNEAAVGYSSAALSALQLSSDGVREFKDELGESVVSEVKELVKQCM